MDINQISSAVAAQQVSSQQSQVRQTVPTAPSSDDKTLAAQAISAYGANNDQVQIKYSTTSKNLDTVLAIEQMHASLNQLVKNVRVTNEGLNQVSEKLDQLQSLAQTVKNYPPYDSGSADRQKTLMSYISIRKEMEQLTVPRPPAPIYEKVKHTWDSLFDNNGKLINSPAVTALGTTNSTLEAKDAYAAIINTGDQLSTLSDNITKALVQS